MARQKPVSEAIPDLELHLNESFNRLVATIMRRLATKKRSPVKVEEFAPWSAIRERKRKDPKNKEYKIDPRFYPPDKVYSYKRRVYIGNTVEYSVYALESGKVQQFVQGPEMRRLISEAFEERRAKISVGARQGIGTFGTAAGRIYTGYTEL
jgi:hypothetical protein